MYTRAKSVYFLHGKINFSDFAALVQKTDVRRPKSAPCGGFAGFCNILYTNFLRNS